MLRRPPPVLYQDHYAWFVFVAALDVMLTWVVLHVGGYEANLLAAAVIEHAGLRGLVGYKFALVLLVVVVCESIGRRNPDAGRRFATFAVAVTCVPLIPALMIIAARG